MRPNQYMAAINDIEKNIPVQKWIIDDVHIWPAIRFKLAESMRQSEHTRTAKAGLAHSRMRIFAQNAMRQFTLATAEMTMSTLDHRHNRSLSGKADAVFITFNSDRIKLLDHYYNKLSEPLNEEFQKSDISGLTLERVIDTIYRIPRSAPSKYIQIRLNLQNFLSSAFAKAPDNDGHTLPGYDEFFRFIKEESLAASIPSISGMISYVKLVKSFSRYFERIFSSLKPKIVISTEYYNTINMAANLACRSLGIISADIQHGLQGPQHFAYGTWNNVPTKGYGLLPAKFLVWSDYEAKAISEWSHSVVQWHEPLIIGNLWLDKWLRGTDEIVSAYDKQLQALLPPDITTSILYTLQDDPPPQWMIDLVKSAPHDWFWWIRLHPSRLYQKKIVKKLFKGNEKNVNIEIATQVPLTALLRHIDVHITKSSTTILEAKAFGIHSVVNDIEGAEIFSSEISDGFTMPGYSADDAVQAIKIQRDKKMKPQNQQTGNQALQGLRELLGILTKKPNDSSH